MNELGNGKEMGKLRRWADEGDEEG